MTRCERLLRTAHCAIACIGLLACGPAVGAAERPGIITARTITLDTAAATIEDGASASRQPVGLPYHWDRRHPGQSGRALRTYPGPVALQWSVLVGAYRLTIASGPTGTEVRIVLGRERC